jgi:hypothetical protein
MLAVPFEEIVPIVERSPEARASSRAVPASASAAPLATPTST